MSSGTSSSLTCVSSHGIMTTMPDRASASASATIRASNLPPGTTPWKKSTAPFRASPRGAYRSATASPLSVWNRTSDTTGSRVNHGCTSTGREGSTCGTKSVVRAAVLPWGVKAISSSTAASTAPTAMSTPSSSRLSITKSRSRVYYSVASIVEGGITWPLCTPMANRRAGSAQS